jgi:hypothetical protein
MPRAARLLLGAYRRYGGREDPLTELLATTLEGYLPFATALFAHRAVRLPPPASVSVSTQVRTDESKRVDVEVVGLDASGSICGRLWSENKTGARYQPDQLSSYLRSIERIPGEGRLITIVPVEGDARAYARPLGIPIFTWRAIAEIAWRSAREHERDARWRSHALEPGAQSGVRLLEELISYLEEDHSVTLDPVHYEHIRAFQLANETSEVLVELLQSTANHARNLNPRGRVSYDVRNDWGHYWQVFEGAPAWVNEAHGYLELSCSDSDDWTLDRIDQPAIGAGATLPEDRFDDLRRTERRPWHDQLEKDAFHLAVSGGRTRVFRTIYLAEITGKGATLDSQAEWLAQWLEDTVERLARLDPPELLPVIHRPSTPSDA